MKLSTRNQLKGKVYSITKGIVNSEVIIHLPGAGEIVSVITNVAVKDLGLQVETEVIALIKSSNVMLGIDVDKISARNVLCGKVSSIVDGAVNTEVIVDLGNGCFVTSVITKTSAHQLALAEGAAISVVIKASSVIVATV